MNTTNEKIESCITFIDPTSGRVTTVKHDMHYSYMDLYDKMKEERKMIPLDYFFTSLNGSIKLMQRYIKLGFIISDFKLWDVELGDNGFNYPIQKTYAIGVNISF